jgi:hypothetical protein
VTTREDVFDAGAEASAIAAAWAQVDTEELAAALRAMPSKVRGRMLQQLKTPAQRITPTAARLLLTNLGRSSTALRYKVAESVTHPIIHDVGDTVDDVGRRPSDVAELVAAAEERWGRSILVLAAVCGMSIDPPRFASVFAACEQLGWLTGELAELAGPIADYAEELAEDADDDTVEEDDGTLPQLWDAARSAAARVGDATGAGAAPDQADLDALGRYRRVLLEEAEGWDVEPTVAAVEAAAAASAEAAQVESLASLLARLEGPDTLAADLDEVRGARDRLGEDPDLAARLSRLVDVVSEDDPDRRFALSAPLVAGPPPPSTQLVLAAAAGALRFAEPPGFADSPFDDADERPDTAGASGQAGPDRSALDAIASSQQSLLGADEAARPGTLFAPPRRRRP